MLFCTYDLLISGTKAAAADAKRGGGGGGAGGKENAAGAAAAVPLGTPAHAIPGALVGALTPPLGGLTPPAFFGLAGASATPTPDGAKAATPQHDEFGGRPAGTPGQPVVQAAAAAARLCQAWWCCCCGCSWSLGGAAHRLCCRRAAGPGSRLHSIVEWLGGGDYLVGRACSWR